MIRAMFNALHLANWDVLAIDQARRDELVITACYEVEPVGCPKCDADGPLLRRGTRDVRYADAPMFGRRTTLVARVRRYSCGSCGTSLRQVLPDIEPGYEMTKRCASYIAEQAVERTFAQVGRMVGIAEKTVREIASRVTDAQLDARQIIAPVVLGIDELKLAGERRCILTDVGEGRVLDLLPSMDGAAVRAWLAALPDKERVRVVTIDMHAAYGAAARAELPHATVVVDKWHLQRKANDALDRVRSRLARGLRGKAKRQAMRGRRLLHARGSNLSPRARTVLDAWLREQPVLAAAWQAKEGFYAVWDGPVRREREQLYDRWHLELTTRWRPVLEEFGPLLWTVRNWRTEIFAYFRKPFTNAYTEAADGLLKIADRMGRGYSFDGIRRRALLTPRLGDRSRWVCEGCLGQFSADAAHLEEIGEERLCGPCAVLVYTMLAPRTHRRRSE